MAGASAIRREAEAEEIASVEALRESAATFDSEREMLPEVGQGGVGPGLTPKQALQLGLKVDAGQLPEILARAIREASMSLETPETTVALLRASSVVGIKAIVEDDRVLSVGLTCALCHSTVDDSITAGIGARLDGWPNRDLDVGQVAALAPNLEPFADLLGVSEDQVRQVFRSWGPGKYDAELNQDGKAMRQTPQARRAPASGSGSRA